MKILIAEDDYISNKLLTKSLEDMTHEVISTDNGQDAWDALEANPDIRVIVSDWMMPGINGLDLCKRVRAKYKDEYIYFVLLTANSDNKESRTQAMLSGIDDFMTKPIDRDEIWMRLQVAERILKYTQKITELEQLFPICSYCKKIRNDEDYWEQVDTYLTQTIGTDFSHSICPNCYDDVIKPQMDALRAQKAAEDEAAKEASN